MQLEECNDEKSLKDMLDSEEFNFRFSCGVTQPTYHMKLDEKEDVISGLCHHFTIYRSIAELDQLVEGLQTLNFNCLMKNYPTLLKQPLQLLSANFIQDFFEVVYSDVGSNDRKREENIIINWITYLRDSEGKFCVCSSLCSYMSWVYNCVYRLYGWRYFYIPYWM